MTLQKKFFLMAVTVMVTAVMIVGSMMVLLVLLGGEDILMEYALFRRRVLHEFSNLHSDGRADFSSLGTVPAGFRFIVVSREGNIEYSSFTLPDRISPESNQYDIDHAFRSSRSLGESLSQIIGYFGGRQFIIETAVNPDTGHSLLMQYSKDADIVMTETVWNPVSGLFVFIIVFLVVSGVGSLIIERAGRSIRALASAAERIANGDMEFDMPGVDRSDEISSLRDSFETMRAGLKEESAKRARFLMAVSHDLKTPLTSIEGYVAAIKDGLARKPEEFEKYLNIVSSKAAVLEERIRELIDFVNMETGEWKLKAETFDLISFLNDLVSDWQSEVEVLHRRFTYRCDMEGPYMVVGDPKLLKRVFENLFDNAVRYTDEGGTISLHAAAIPENGFAITVSDDGPGIPEEMEEQIFEPFYRGTRSRREQGFGLGLSIVRSILYAHGWDIRVQRCFGGAAFLIRIPASRTMWGSI